MTQTSTCRSMFLTRHLLRDSADAHPCDSAATSCSFTCRPGYFYQRRTHSRSSCHNHLSALGPAALIPLFGKPPACILRKWKIPAPSHVCVLSVGRPHTCLPCRSGRGLTDPRPSLDAAQVDSQPPLVLPHPPTVLHPVNTHRNPP